MGGLASLVVVNIAGGVRWWILMTLVMAKVQLLSGSEFGGISEPLEVLPIYGLCLQHIKTF